MSEIIYTKINPKDYIEDIGLTISNINETLIESIKKEGIKFPILGFCNNKIIKFLNIWIKFYFIKIFGYYNFLNR